MQTLCQDEIARRDTVAFQRRLDRAKFEWQVALEEFDFAASLKLPAAPDPRPRRPTWIAERRCRQERRAHWQTV
ncbi:hypothetical protein ACFYPC_01510 [Streptomyces sp. NPDC005808]|uniref:hypothetical protein n=1 Tax=Streptomyces sp. NPDC005808 TaxID=3364734 RepID=UPI0036C4B02D